MRPWIAAWRKAVDESDGRLSLIDLWSGLIVGVSPRGAELMNVDPADAIGRSFLEFTDHPQEAALAMRLLAQGVLNGIKGFREFRQAGGSTVKAHTWGWAIRSPCGPDLALWVRVADEGDRPDPTTWAPDIRELVESPATAQLTGPVVAAGRLDDRWRVAEIELDGRETLGWTPGALVGGPFMELSHPSDRVGVLVALARATAEGKALVHVRLRQSDGGWQRCMVLMEPSDGATCEFTFAIRGHEIPDLPALPGGERLSSRQRDVVRRLSRGERVATIAKEMFVSQSTVRNHLAAIFGKFGVHSQAELLALMRHAGSGSTSGE